MKVLFLGDVFSVRAIEALERNLPNIIKKHKADFVIVQAENVSGRKGFVKRDYLRLKKCGVDAFTLGNHIWAKDDIDKIIENDDIIRPLNVKNVYPGKGTRVFTVKGQTIRVTQMLGITFNPLNRPWKQQQANNFFDSFDKLEKEAKTDFHILDFHGEVTSEKNVFGLYTDGKVSAFLGTHTHVQTNDARRLPKGSLYITDAGMTGPTNSAIGASYETVYQKMRYDAMVRFEVSDNRIQFNAVLLNFGKDKSEITAINTLIK